MSHGNDTSGLQVLLSGVVAPGLVLCAAGVFIYRLYAYRDQQADQEDN